MERGILITEFTVQVLTEDMFGEMQRYEMKCTAGSYEEIQHAVFEMYGELEYEIVGHETFELPIFA
jgi:hypothetical protein